MGELAGHRREGSPPGPREIFRDAWSIGKAAWRRLLVLDLAAKLLAFAVLTPLAGLALRAAVGLSGSSVLADLDILYFLLRPIGLALLLVAAALALAIVALEQAGLMAIGVGAAEGAAIDAGQAMRFALRRAPPVAGLTARLVARVLLLAAPFLAGLGGIYLLLLRRFDINFYLARRPPEFFWAVALAAILGLGLLVVVVPRLVGWSLALPLVLFEGLPPGSALRESALRTAGSRGTIRRVLLLWGAGALTLSLAVPGAIFALVRLLVRQGIGRVGLVLASMLLLVALWAVTNLLLTWVNGSAFALLIVRLHRSLGGSASEVRAQLDAADDLVGDGGPRFSLSRALGALALLALVAGGAGLFLLQGLRSRDAAVVIAHRGAAAEAPENTLAATTLALAQRADYVEIDVQETAEGEVAVLHDSDLMRVGGVDLKIWEATRERLATIDIGSWFRPEFFGERVPSLAEVLQGARGRGRVLIELKYYGHDERLEQRVAGVVEALGQTDDVAVMSLEYDQVQRMRALRPDWTVGLLTAKAVGDLATLDADFLAVNAGMADRRFIRRAHARDKKVYVWTINDPVQMFRMLNLGVDGLITDRPALARWVIERRARMSVAERLLVGIAFYCGAAAPDPPASLDAPD